MAKRIQSSGSYRPRKAKRSTRLPAHFANHPWTYVHYPRALRFDPKRGFLPDLCEIILKPGANGVGIHPETKEILPSKAWGGALQKGGRIILTDDPRLGEHKGYVREYRCQGGGKRYAHRGEQFTLFDGGAVGHTEAPPKMLLDFLEHVQRAGITHPITWDGVRIRLAIEHTALKRLRRAKATEEEIAAKKLLIEQMDAAWAKLLEDRPSWFAPDGAPGEEEDDDEENEEDDDEENEDDEDEARARRRRPTESESAREERLAFEAEENARRDRRLHSDAPATAPRTLADREPSELERLQELMPSGETTPRTVRKKDEGGGE